MREKDFQPDIILTLSKGASFRPHHAVLKLPNFHHKWMAYIHDPYPFHYYPEPYTWSEPGYLSKIAFFEAVAAQCKWAGYPSLLLAEWMEDHYQDFKNKRVIIPHQLNAEKKFCGVLPDWFDPGKFNILHAGNLMKQRDPLPLIKAFQKFLLANPGVKREARLLLIGSASYHLSELKGLEEVVEELYISDGYVPYEEVLKMQEKAAVNVILESVAEMSPFLPGKFPHCIVTNKPILHLGPELSEVRRLLGAGYPYYAEANDIDEISLMLEKLYFSWKENGEILQAEWSELSKYLSAEHLEEQINNFM
ncbi:UDP-glycosyltransferase [Salegentibacter sp. HM20]